MNWQPLVGIISGIVQAASMLPYVWSIVRGTTRPSFISNLLWTLLGIIEVAAQWSAGASWSIVVVIIVTFNTGFVASLCLFGYGYKKWGVVDVWCLALSLAAIVGWGITGNPLVALALALLANIFASTPTIIKGYRDPYADQFLSWFMVVFAACLSILSITFWTPANLIIPIYLLVESVVMSLLLFVGQRLYRIRR
jgi:hypothetical protein